MFITGTHIAYLHVCHRKLWLFGNGIGLEHSSELVAEGRLIGETSYSDRSRMFTEVEIDGVKIDFYDRRNKLIHEVKKSSSMEEAHVAQVKYYIFKLWLRGVMGVKGLIEYPKLREKVEVEVTERELALVATWENEVRRILQLGNCPPVLNARLCRNCSYHDFCYSSE